jgi:hypothetical protein
MGSMLDCISAITLLYSTRTVRGEAEAERIAADGVLVRVAGERVVGHFDIAAATLECRLLASS